MFGRVPAARRMTTADPKRLAVSLLGVGAAVGLVLLLQGLWNGQLVQITAYEDHAGADLFVAQPDTESLLGDTSRVPLSALEPIRALPMVRAADPAHFHATIVELHKGKEFVFIAGSAPTGLGGPWDLTDGRNARAGGEAVVDSILAEEHGLALGDSFDMKGREFEIVGLSDNSRSWMAAFIFVTDDSARLLTGSGETASFILVQTDQPAEAAAAIEEITGLSALDPAFLAGNDRQVLAGIMGNPVLLMIGIAFAAATLVVALTVYSGVVERLREYGIVKALGAGRLRILRLILGQTVLLAVVGSAVGYIMYLGGVWLVGRLRPQFWFSLEGRHLLLIGGASAVMALVAAVMPVRRLGRLDPASVYRGW
jgi:putative ABC transport system permease protein